MFAWKGCVGVYLLIDIHNWVSKQSAMNGAQFVSIGIPTIWRSTLFAKTNINVV
jgi:hypothetical protein